ncbi:hypothetical protein PENTCL1PPCAC_4635, partial [Pristionchus entomophagus]
GLRSSMATSSPLLELRCEPKRSPNPPSSAFPSSKELECPEPSQLTPTPSRRSFTTWSLHAPPTIPSSSLTFWNNTETRELFSSRPLWINTRPWLHLASAPSLPRWTRFSVATSSSSVLIRRRTGTYSSTSTRIWSAHSTPSFFQSPHTVSISATRSASRASRLLLMTKSSSISTLPPSTTSPKPVTRTAPELPLCR